jgi:hypothetical protein
MTWATTGADRGVPKVRVLVYSALTAPSGTPIPSWCVLGTIDKAIPRHSAVHGAADSRPHHQGGRFQLELGHRTVACWRRRLRPRRCHRILPENLGLRSFKLLVGQHSAIPEVGDLV